MNTTAFRRADVRPVVARAVVVLAGLGHLLTGLALLFAPHWFYANIGTFPPFNRHYAGDLGAFQIALGAGLLLAARNPARQRLLIWVIAAGNLAHTLNHAFDALIDHAALARWVIEIGPLALMSLALILVSSGLFERESSISLPFRHRSVSRRRPNQT